MGGIVRVCEASAIDADLTVWDSTMVEVPIKRAMIAAAGRVVLLADAAKFQMGGIVRVCEASAIDQIVTDAPLGAEFRPALEQAGITLTVA